MAQLVEAVDLAIPLLVQPGDQVAIGGVHREAAESRAQFLDARSGVAHQSQPAVLLGIEVQHVEIDEVDVRISENGVRRGGEVGPAGADPNHHVGLAGQSVGGQRAGRADRAEVRRMIIRQ